MNINLKTAKTYLMLYKATKMPHYLKKAKLALDEYKLDLLANELETFKIAA